MRLLSQDLFGEKWVDGLEDELWDAVFKGKKFFDQIQFSENSIKSFRDLATLANGWWYQAIDDELTFTSLRNWREMLAEEKAEATEANDSDHTNL